MSVQSPQEAIKSNEQRKRRYAMRRAGALVLAGASVIAVAYGAKAGTTAVIDRLNQPTHVEKLKSEFDKAKADPASAPEGKYVWVTVDGSNPTTVAQHIAKKGEITEVTAELEANEIEENVGGITQMILPAGNALVIKANLNLDDKLVRRATSEFVADQPQQ